MNKTETQWKSFKDVQPGDLGIDYLGDCYPIVDKGMYEDMYKKYPNSCDWDSDDDLYTNVVVAKVNPRASLEGYTHHLYAYGGEGMLVANEKQPIMELESKLLMLTASIPVEAHGVKAKAIIQFMIDDNPDSTPDVEITDFDEITHNGLPVDGYEQFKKLKQFYKDTHSIDIDDLLDKETEKYLTPDAKKAFMQQHANFKIK